MGDLDCLRSGSNWNSWIACLKIFFVQHISLEMRAVNGHAFNNNEAQFSNVWVENVRDVLDH